MSAAPAPSHAAPAPSHAAPAPSRAAARWTGVVWLLAAASIIDTISEAARFATDADDHLGWLRLVLGGVASVSFTAWAFRRSRGARAAAVEQGEEGGALPAFPSAGRWRWLRWMGVVVVVAVGTVTIVDQWGTFEQAVSDLRHLHWRWVRWSIYAEVGSIVAFAWLWARLLRAGGARLRFGSIIGLTLAGNALLVSLPGGVAFSTTFSFKALRRRGVPGALAARVLVASTVLSILALLGLALVGADLAGAAGPSSGLGPLVTIALAGAAVSLIGIVIWMRRSGRLAALRARLAALAGELPRSALLSGFLAALSNWVLDCACLITAILAVSGHVPWEGVLVAYAVGQLAENLPITPGGIGVVEGSLTLMLVAYGMHNSTALAAVLLYRLISFWVLVPVGWVAVAAIVARRRGTRAAPAVARPLL